MTVDFEYTIKRSDTRSRITITVERDRSVIVHAPVQASDKKISEIVESKRFWILQKIYHDQKYDNQGHPPGKELVSGESALYLGKLYRIQVVDRKSAEIQFSQVFTIPRSLATQRSAVLRDWYVKRANEKMLPRVRRYAKQLGVSIELAKIVDNRCSWGSCTAKGRVSLNWRLIKAPIFVVDYVIVHELAHLLESNHTPRFWSIVRAQMPMMEKAKAWLQVNGQVLEEEI